MKKILVVCAALLLPCFLVRAQEADDTGTGVGLSVIPRLDLSLDDGQFTLGNSSIYSLFEGNITDKLSFSVENHWAGFNDVSDLFGATRELYQNTLTRQSNWLDWAYLAYNIGNWTITAGKDMITTGGWEFDENDYDAHPVLHSSFWNTFAPYQWGVKLGYNLSEKHALSLQVLTSPTVSGLFEKPYFAYSLGWQGHLAGVQTKWSYTGYDGLDELGDRKWSHIIALGQKYEMDKISFALDLFEEINPAFNRFTATPSVLWSICDSLELLVKGGYENMGGSHYGFGGAAIQWYPVKNLRVHAVAAYNGTPVWNCASFTLGAIYYLNIL